MDPPPTNTSTLSLHDALPIYVRDRALRRRARPRPRREVDRGRPAAVGRRGQGADHGRSEEHTSELQSLRHLVCRLLLEKKNSQKSISDGGTVRLTQWSRAPVR